MRRIGIYPNAYYNYRKHRKENYNTQREVVLRAITDIYHKHNGVTGYRSMQVYLKRKGFIYSRNTIHKYMNTLLGLKSIVRPKRTEYKHRKGYKVFENKINGNFTASKMVC